MVKTVIFDFGGVLGSDANAWKKNPGKILEATGLSIDKIEEIGNSHWKKLNRDKEDLAVLLDDICRRSKKDVSISTLEKIYEQDISINNDVLQYAKRLKSKGFNMVILSNESRKGMEMKTKKFNLDKTFSKIYCSAFLGMVKPNVRIFNYVLKDLDVKANEVIFIDDRVENVRCAVKLGVKGILFKNLNQLKKEIAKLGISTQNI